ncbi:MAG: prepilin-type N-terminal cleavage/methylation domain-containing protein [Deltaproteobacteria bacterium]|nr:prepilin-type N-terminal cleavage/methylation domain-containing protein [Deltaproteobacteria bacterium]
MDDRGFTLIEVLVASVIGAVVLLGISNFYLSTLRLGDQSSSQTFLQRQASFIIEEMARQTRPACDLALNSGCPATPSLRVTQPGATGCDGPSYCFYRSGDQLRELRILDSSEFNLLNGSPVPLAVTTFTAELPSAPTARITFELRDNFSNSMKFGTAFSSRNSLP